MTRLRAALALAAVWLVLPTPATSACPPEHLYSFRGVIFGPYGRPWSHEDRLRMMPWMGQHCMNVYVHAAKDDVYQRLQWRDPYPAAAMYDFDEEIEAARDAGVQWVPNLSPGFPLIPSATPPTGPPSSDVCFSCPSDVEAIVRKLQPFLDRRVGTVMISFDDVQKISTHPEDALRFGVGNAAYGEMNAWFLNALHAALPGVRILTVPADYSGTAQTAYLASFGARLSGDIQVMWTGTAVVSHRILASEAADYAAAVSPPGGPIRKLVVWDNFPVNDYNGNIFSTTGLPTNFKLNVGPYKGRHADLVDILDGILANPMNEAEASKIPLYTVAAYLNDPGSYTTEDVADDLAEAAWVAGIDEMGGAEGKQALFDFVSQMRSTPFDRTESPRFDRRRQTFTSAYAGAFWGDAWEALIAELAAEKAAAPFLRKRHLPSDDFLRETRNHLDQLKRNARAGLLAAEALASARPQLEVEPVQPGLDGRRIVHGTVAPPDPVGVARRLAKLAPLEVERRLSPYSVHGDRLQHDFANLYFNENLMDRFVNDALAATAAWLPTAALASAGPLSVTVNGSAASIEADGHSFRAEVAPAPIYDVIVTDAAGGQTGRHVPGP